MNGNSLTHISHNISHNLNQYIYMCAMEDLYLSVINDTINSVAEDPEYKGRFDGTPLEKLKELWIEHLTEKLRGPGVKPWGGDLFKSLSSAGRKRVGEAVGDDGALALKKQKLGWSLPQGARLEGTNDNSSDDDDDFHDVPMAGPSRASEAKVSLLDDAEDGALFSDEEEAEGEAVYEEMGESVGSAWDTDEFSEPDGNDLLTAGYRGRLTVPKGKNKARVWQFDIGPGICKIGRRETAFGGGVVVLQR